MDIALVNSWINFKEDSGKNITLHQFQENLITQIEIPKFWWKNQGKSTEQSKNSISNEPGHQKNKENQMEYLHDNDEEERDPDYEEEKKKNNPINFQHFAQNHVPQVIKRTKTSERRGRCEWCKLSRIGKNRGNKDIRVNTMCSGCNVYLHFEGCWEFFHRAKIA